MNLVKLMYCFFPSLSPLQKCLFYVHGIIKRPPKTTTLRFPTFIRSKKKPANTFSDLSFWTQESRALLLFPPHNGGGEFNYQLHTTAKPLNSPIPAHFGRGFGGGFNKDRLLKKSLKKSQRNKYFDTNYHQRMLKLSQIVCWILVPPPPVEIIMRAFISSYPPS